jgi:hypothetical protein
VELWPACNVEVFPLNSLEANEEDDLVISYNAVRGKLPFPPMALKEIRKIVNYNQTASNKHIKTAILLSKASEETINEYREKTNDKDSKITCKQLTKDLNPKL